MAESKLAGRYAKSLIGLAQEQGLFDVINNDMQLIAKTCENSRELTVVLHSPIIKSDKKMAVLSELFNAKVNPLSIAFIKIITHKNRAAYLPAIAREFTNLYKEAKNIVTAVVTSAVALDEKLRKEVMAVIKKGSSAEVELIEKVDPTLIGGFVLRIGDKQYDDTISASLRRLTKDFSGNSYVLAN